MQAFESEGNCNYDQQTIDENTRPEYYLSSWYCFELVREPLVRTRKIRTNGKSASKIVGSEISRTDSLDIDVICNEDCEYKLKMEDTQKQDEQIARMIFADIYPLYLAKIERKGRTAEELQEVILWLTGYNETELQTMIDSQATFTDFFGKATLNPNAELITGKICGYKVEDIKTPLTQQARYLDKLVDELAKGKAMEKILRKPK